MSKEVVLGFISGLSGVYGWMANDQLRGVKLAVEEINAAGGILGTPVRLESRDDTTDVELSYTLTKELIKDAKVDMIIGGLSAPTHLKINAATKEAGVLFMSIGQNYELCTGTHLGPFTFHECFDPYMTALGVGSWVSKHIGKKWYILLADYAWGHNVLKAYSDLADRLGVEIVGTTKVPFPATSEEDFLAVLPAIKKAEPDVLLAANYGQDQLLFLSAIGKTDIKMRVSIVNTLSELPIIRCFDPETAAGVYWAGNFYWGLAETIPKAKQFVDQYKKTFNAIPSGYSAYGYSGARELLEATIEAGALPVDAEKVARVLEGRSYGHYKTEQWWRPCDHQSFHDVYIFKVKGPEERTSDDDVCEVVGSTPWGLDMARTCDEMGQKNHQWGHFE